MKILRCYLVTCATLCFFTSDAQSLSRGFIFLNEFDMNGGSFEFMPLDWLDSKDGEAAYMFSSDKNHYWVFNIQQYKERSKTDYFYVSDKQKNIIVIRIVHYAYDRPWNDPGVTVNVTVSYVSFEHGEPRFYDHVMKPVDGSQLATDVESLKLLFKNATKTVATE